MYRKLVWLPVLAFCALAATMAAGPGWHDPVTPLYARLTGWLPGNHSSDLGLALTFFLTGLMPLLLGLALTWFTAFDPGHKTHPVQAIAKYVAALAVVTQLLTHIFYRATQIAQATHAVAQQIPKPLPTLLLIAGLPYALLEIIAISFILSAPLYWLFRGLKVASIQRATFEAWIEIKRLLIPALVLLATATVLQTWLSPVVSTSLLR